jgi:hypothetical protein
MWPVAVVALPGILVTEVLAIIQVEGGVRPMFVVVMHIIPIGRLLVEKFLQVRLGRRSVSITILSE